MTESASFSSNLRPWPRPRRRVHAPYPTCPREANERRGRGSAGPRESYRQVPQAGVRETGVFQTEGDVSPRSLFLNQSRSITSPIAKSAVRLRRLYPLWVPPRFDYRPWVGWRSGRLLALVIGHRASGGRLPVAGWLVHGTGSQSAWARLQRGNLGVVVQSRRPHFRLGAGSRGDAASWGLQLGFPGCTVASGSEARGPPTSLQVGQKGIRGLLPRSLF